MFRRIRTSLALLTALAMTALVAGRIFGSRSGSDDPERGDVPGWVMITMMSACSSCCYLGSRSACSDHYV